MAQKKKGGLISRLMLGSEKSEGYARASLPSNRWELFWDIFKGRFGKLVIINLLVLLFCVPFALLLFFRYIAITNYGVMYPFSQGFGIGYAAPPSMVGYAENIVFTVNLMVYLFAPLAFMIAAVGISGGAYVIRNMVWTEGIFVANDFWRGIKQNIKQMLVIFLVYSIIFYVSVLSLSLSDQSLAAGTGGKDWMFIISKILTYLVLVTFSIMTMHMITMSVTYELKYTNLLKNSFLFTVGLLPQNIFFIAMGLIPWVLLLFGGFFTIIGVILLILFGFSLILLIWTNFCHWSYDRFINDKIPGAQKNRGIYEKIKESDAGALKQYREQMAMVRSSLNSKPIKPITDDDLKLEELPTSFNRADIQKLNASKQAIYDDHAKYVEEHKNDPEFQMTEEEKAAEKEQEERQKRIEKAKKELAKRNKNQ